jgi:ethanolamine ammonia-lyase small subunit
VSTLDPEAIARIVREVMGEVLAEEAKPRAPLGEAHTAPSQKQPKAAAPTETAARVNPGQAESATPGRRGPRHRALPEYRRAEVVEELVGSTPARILQGRTGTRYLTETYLGLRADHAIALDAVESQVPEGWAEQQGWLPLLTQATDHQDFLLYPDHGRRLEAKSKARLEQEASKDVDVQIIAGDGLSAHALMLNGPPLVSALAAAFSAAGYRVGRPLFVKFARIGVADEIGVVTRARSTLIIVGERPGLGTGDSLSIYSAVGPKLGQDNAEKDCISNVRRAGLGPEEAAARCADLMRRAFAAGGGGVRLARAGGGK